MLPTMLLLNLCTCLTSWTSLTCWLFGLVDLLNLLEVLDLFVWLGLVWFVGMVGLVGLVWLVDLFNLLEVFDLMTGWTCIPHLDDIYTEILWYLKAPSGHGSWLMAKQKDLQSAKFPKKTFTRSEMTTEVQIMASLIRTPLLFLLVPILHNSQVISSI